MNINNQDALRVGGTVIFVSKDAIGILASDGTIYWTEGNIGIDLKELPFGVVVDIYYKKLTTRKYPMVVWVEKKALLPDVEQIVLSKTDASILVEAIENPPEPNDALKELMSDDEHETSDRE